MKRSIAKAFLVGILLLAGVLTPAIVRAEDSTPATHESEPDPITIYIQSGADSEQADRIRKLAMQFQVTNEGRAREAMALLHDITNLSAQPNLNEKKLIADQSRINDLQSSMALDRLKLLIHIRQILTPSQRLKLVDLLQQQRAIPSGAAPSASK